VFFPKSKKNFCFQSFCIHICFFKKNINHANHITPPNSANTHPIPPKSRTIRFLSSLRIQRTHSHRPNLRTHAASSRSSIASLRARGCGMGRMGARVVAGARGNRALKLLDVAGNGFVVGFGWFLSGFWGLDRKLDPKKCKNGRDWSFFEVIQCIYVFFFFFFFVFLFLILKLFEYTVK
jgi:hypothetical protein